MSYTLVISLLAAYFTLLLVISIITGKGSDSNTFFTGNHQSPWYLVAFGMIGASLSGVTFISIPGEVGTSQFSYFQVVLGYLVGYLVIGTILMPLYYRLKLISIYSYLEQRLGFWSYKSGSFYFILSRLVGASFRLFLVANVLQMALFDALEIPFWITVSITIMLIWIYTFRSGIKTIVFTDTIQTLFMLITVGMSIVLIMQELDLTTSQLMSELGNSKYSKIFFWDWRSGKYFFKQFFAGAFIAIVMTGLDQDMMQKNLTCKNLEDAQKNMFWFSIVLVISNFLFLSLGALLYIYAETNGIAIPEMTDQLYPMLALDHFPVLVGSVFILGLIAAAYSSADSALTSLTTSFCIDFLGFAEKPEKGKNKIRMLVHLGFSLLLLGMIMLFSTINDRSVISALFKAAGYTYGPLLGMFSFGLFTKWEVKDSMVPGVVFLSPIISFVINANSQEWLWGYIFSFDILILNGLLTFLGLYMIRTKKED